MVGLAVLDVVLDGKSQSEQDGRIDLALAARHDFHRPRQMLAHPPVGAGAGTAIEQIALRQDNQIGTRDLVLEHFFDGVVMIERRVAGALRGERRRIGGDAAFGQCRTVDHGDHPVDRHPALDRWPLERLHQGLGQSQPGSLDEDVVDLRAARQDQVESRHEVVRDGAADAAVGELDDILLRASLDPAALEDVSVDADVAELVDDDGEPLAFGMLDHMADQRRLAGAEKAGDHGAGHPSGESVHSVVAFRAVDGWNAGDQPPLQTVGPAAPGHQPVGEPASSSAPATRSAPSAGVRSPNT